MANLPNYHEHWRHKLLKHGTRWNYMLGGYIVARVVIDRNIKTAPGDPIWRAIFDLPGLGHRNLNFHTLKDAQEYVRRLVREWLEDIFHAGEGCTERDTQDIQGTPPACSVPS